MLYDALWNEECAYSLLSSMGQGTQFQGTSGTVVGSATALFDEVAERPHAAAISVMKAEQSNTSVKFGDRVIMKLYRRVEPGINPELEIGSSFTARIIFVILLPLWVPWNITSAATITNHTGIGTNLRRQSGQCMGIYAVPTLPLLRPRFLSASNNKDQFET